MLNQIDSSRELLLRPHLNGVEFVRPEQSNASFLPLRHVMESSIATYIMTTESKVFDANEATLTLNHVPSLKTLVGCDAFDLWKGEAARLMMQHDADVMQKHALLITDDSAESYTGVYEAMMTFKMPLYSQQAVVGVLGFTLQIDSSNVSRLASQLTMLMQSGLIKPEKIDALQQNLSSPEHQIYFSKRETEVLSYVVKGYTAKKISIILKLSMRTVEHHIENIKLKSGCKRKYELIYKFADKFSNIQ